LVYCDRCGARADMHDRYCRSCGQVLGHPPFLWQIRQRQRQVPAGSVGDAPAGAAVGSGNRKPTPESIERESAIDMTPQPSLPFAEPKASLVQLQQQAPNPEELLAERTFREMNEDRRAAAFRARRRVTMMVGCALLLLGGAGLVISIVESSTVLALIGLGLVLWGALLLFVRPLRYVQLNLMDSTALSSLKTIDRIMLSLGYLEKGVYIPGGNPDKAIVFVPAEPFSRIPKASEIEGQTLVKDPKGLALVPPGLSLADLIESQLGVPLKNCTLRDLSRRLPGLLVENLEMVRDFDMQVEGDIVRLKFIESIYSGFCNKLRNSAKVSCALGCPICSAMACVIAQTTGKPVLFEGDVYSNDGRVLESTYRILEA